MNLRFRTLHLLELIVAAAVLAACAAAGTSPQLSASARQQSAAADNRQRAERAADRLLARVRAPRGATALSSTPTPLAGPMTGPSVTSEVDRSRLWQVQMSYYATLSWLRAHPPHGLAHDGSSQSGGPDYQTDGDFYDAPDRPGLIGQQIQITITAVDTTTTAIRADAIAIWLDPRPIRDRHSGSRLHVVSAADCPANLHGANDVNNPGVNLNDALLPARRPSSGLECRYSGGNGKPAFGLQQQQRLDRAAAARLAATVRAVDLSHPDGGSSSCPSDDGSAVVIAFSYPKTPDIDVWFGSTGCEYLSNGSIIASPGKLARTLAAN
jgi:hypothetical protein